MKRAPGRTAASTAVAAVRLTAERTDAPTREVATGSKVAPTAEWSHTLTTQAEAKAAIVVPG